MPLFGAIDRLRWIQTQKRNPLNRCRLMNGRLNFSHFCTGTCTGARRRERPEIALTILLVTRRPQGRAAFATQLRSDLCEWRGHDYDPCVSFTSRKKSWTAEGGRVLSALLCCFRNAVTRLGAYFILTRSQFALNTLRKVASFAKFGRPYLIRIGHRRNTSGGRCANDDGFADAITVTLS